MKYQEFIPNKLLRPYIDRYFFMVADHCIEDSVQLNLPPNGTSGLLLQCGDFYKVTNRLNKMDKLPNVYIMGQPSECFTVELSGKFEIFGVHFTPTGLHRMFSLPIHEFTDQGVDADQLLGKSVNQMGEQLWDCSETSRKVAQLEMYFLRHLIKSQSPIKTADIAVDRLPKMGGQLEITHLAKQLKVSRRTLERHFFRSVGLYPKQFSQIARLNHFFKMSSSQPGFSWHDLIHACGFYDQSHFIHTFQPFMGQTSTQYWEKLNPQDNIKKSVRFSCRGITAGTRK
jgi:AraC-like DNA-binding protein